MAWGDCETKWCSRQSWSAALPRYYFNIFDGEERPDQDGTELPDLDVVRTEAVRLSGSIIRELGASFWDHSMGEWVLEVVDESGNKLLRLRFSGERLN